MQAYPRPVWCRQTSVFSEIITSVRSWRGGAKRSGTFEGADQADDMLARVVNRFVWYLVYFLPGFNPWVGKTSWRRKWIPTPVFLSGESHGQRSLVGYSPWNHKELDMTFTFSFSACRVSGLLSIDFYNPSLSHKKRNAILTELEMGSLGQFCSQKRRYLSVGAMKAEVVTPSES